jgi:hypothetical protein
MPTKHGLSNTLISPMIIYHAFPIWKSESGRAGKLDRSFVQIRGIACVPVPYLACEWLNCRH